MFEGEFVTITLAGPAGRLHSLLCHPSPAAVLCRPSRASVSQYPHESETDHYCTGLRSKIDAHFGSSPLIKQRAEFLSVNAATPLDRKVKFTPEVVGAAAAYESWKVFERDPAHKPADGSKLAHMRGKQVSPALFPAIILARF